METFQKVLPRGLGISPSARILFGKDSGRRNPSSIQSGPRLRSKPLASERTKGPAPGTAADAPSPPPVNSGKVEGLQHLGVVDNEGGPQPVLEGTPVSRHAAADGPSQMSLAEEVTCPGKGGAHLRLPGACREPGPRGTGRCQWGCRGGGSSLSAGLGDGVCAGTRPHRRRHDILGSRWEGCPTRKPRPGHWRPRCFRARGEGPHRQPRLAGQEDARGPYPASQT